MIAMMHVWYWHMYGEVEEYEFSIGSEEAKEITVQLIESIPQAGLWIENDALWLPPHRILAVAIKEKS